MAVPNVIGLGCANTTPGFADPLAALVKDVTSCYRPLGSGTAGPGFRNLPCDLACLFRWFLAYRDIRTCWLATHSDSARRRIYPAARHGWGIMSRPTALLRHSSYAARPSLCSSRVGSLWNIPFRAALVAVNIAVILFFLTARTSHGFSLGGYRIDLDVYRIASRIWLRGGNPYRNLLTTAQGIKLWYTYPPIAVVLLAPLAMVPMWLSGVLLTLASTVALALTLLAFGVRGWALMCVLPGALFLEPMWSTLDYGQINALLMAMVAVDCLAVTPRWPRGCLVGLAAAVKLAPALFLLYFLLRRDYRAASLSAISFTAATALGFALAPTPAGSGTRSMPATRASLRFLSGPVCGRGR
jgi:hypothetical protein